MTGADVPERWRAMRPVQLFDRLAAAPDVGAAMHRLGGALLGALDGRDAERIALRVSAVRDCPYVWRGHCRIATLQLDEPLSAEEVARIAHGPGALEGHAALIVGAVDELLAGRHPAALAELEPPVALAVVVATHFYAAVTVLMRDAPPEPDALPLPNLRTPAEAVAWLAA